MLAAASRRPHRTDSGRGIPWFVERPAAIQPDSLSSSEYPRGSRPLTAGLHGKRGFESVVPPDGVVPYTRLRLYRLPSDGGTIERDPWKT